MVAGKRKKNDGGKPPPTDPFVRWRLSNGMGTNGPPIRPDTSVAVSDFAGNGVAQGPGGPLPSPQFRDLFLTSGLVGIISASVNLLRVGQHAPLLGWNPIPPLPALGSRSISEVYLEISPMGTAVRVEMTIYYVDSGLADGLAFATTTIP